MKKHTTLLATAVCGLSLSLAGVSAPAQARTSARESAARPSSHATATSTDQTAVTRSGLPWKSGVFAHSSAKANGFEQMRGEGVDLVSVHPARDSFAAMMDPWWLDDTAGIRRAGASLEVSVPLWPSNGDVHTTATSAWRAFGGLLVRRGESDAIVTIGKEFNLDNPWHITAQNQVEWRTRFRQAVNALRSVPNQHFQIAWTPNEGPSQTGVASTAAWPGARYVDIVAPDYYDQWDPIHTWAQARARFNRTYGIRWWFNWAIKRHVKVGVSEWGVSSGTQWAGHTGGDNPFYVTAMHRLFQQYGGSLAYESYFDEPESYVASSLVSQNPKARAAYRSLW